MTNPPPQWPRLNVWRRVGLIWVAVSLAGAIAYVTRDDAHPDEFSHVDAFRYFEQRWWPPNLGSDEVLYSRYGWSRVYTGEMVYILYGKLGKTVQMLWKSQDSARTPYFFYRLLNVGLFLLTLMVLFFVPCGSVNPTVIGMTFVCIPQVHYLYAYANSDAWGLSMAVFLFVLAARMIDRPVPMWSWGQVSLLGILTGLIVTAKSCYLPSLVLPHAMIGMKVAHALQSRELRAGWEWFGRLIVGGLAVMLISAPLKFLSPITQGDFRSAIEHMREVKAEEGFKPSNPTFPTYRLASKGETYFSMVTQKPWVEWSLKSFYGTYGYMSVWNPLWM